MRNYGIDEYVYPDTTVLKKTFNIRDAAQLEQLEIKIFTAQYAKGIPNGNFDSKHLKKIHAHFFSELYEWAGKERNVSIAKGNSFFASPLQIEPALTMIFKQLKADNYLTNVDSNSFATKAGYYFSELNVVHPIREGNGS